VTDSRPVLLSAVLDATDAAAAAFQQVGELVASTWTAFVAPSA
jgi:hypothetical protein